MTRISEVLAKAGIAVHRAKNSDRSSAARRNDGPPPEYITNVIEDISAKLGDVAHLRANATQAKRLWQQSGLSVEDFVQTLYDIRNTVRWQAKVENRMAYFFKALRVALGLEENPNQQPRGAAATEVPEQRQSLAGKYAHLVRR